MRRVILSAILPEGGGKMVILISGASHTGKTLLAQKLMERYGYPVFSMDLLKMGLIRSGQTDLSPEDDELLVPYLWGIVKEIVKTALENGQDLIVEGCYIPFGWKDDFQADQLAEIEFCCLVMTRDYLENHGEDVLRFQDAVERRLDDKVDIDELIRENECNLASCRERGLRCFLIDRTYDVGRLEIGSLVNDDFDAAARLFCGTVHSVNARDYSQEQIDAWAPCDGRHHGQIAGKLATQRTVGVKECGILVGFGSLDGEGDIDMLFVHKDRQGQGIARIILGELERMVLESGRCSASLFSSITARPFFEHMGYAVEWEDATVRNGISLTRYRMGKRLA